VTARTPYALVAILEVPDDKRTIALALVVGFGSNAGTTTLRAFNSGEMPRILVRLGWSASLSARRGLPYKQRAWFSFYAVNRLFIYSCLEAHSR